jgi:hypothetical protein
VGETDLVVAGLAPQDHAAIAQAVAYLEDPSLWMRLADGIGKPAERLAARMPERAQTALAKAVDAALHKALDVAVQSLDGREAGSGRLHTAIAAAVGGAAGAAGIAGLAVELPLVTAVMLRGIAAVARQEGADLDDPAVRLECLAVLAMGGPARPAGDGHREAERPLGSMESSYWTARLGLMMAVRAASQQAAGVTARQLLADLAAGAAPAVARLLGLVASRFQTVVGEKALAQAVPVAGALAGASLNAAFTDHFQTVARHHFGLRRLERLHGETVVRQAYADALRQRRSET